MDYRVDVYTVPDVVDVVDDILWRSISNAALAFSQQLDVLLNMNNHRQSRRWKVSYLVTLLESYKMCCLTYEEITSLG